MIVEKLTDFPDISDLSFVTSRTIIALQHPCDRIISKTTVGALLGEMHKPQKDYFESLTDYDRTNLCDIMWYLIGMKDAGSNTFSDQTESLRKVITCLGDKYRKP